MLASPSAQAAHHVDIITKLDAAISKKPNQLAA
ncbi:hypothetical protein PITC_043890 [Penicillium italicum]|uniref:Uncharacterized protein n=1 Tax=Penicillium italicum TaxID=40296 RepID=A0A0A2L6Q7_PENIT|nr:hypothetical protein PITC_043890 [Penicillium italicum]